MDIKKLLEEYQKFIGCPECGCKEGQCECGEECDCKKEQQDESLNEEKDLASEPAKMEKDEYKEIKPVKPEVDGDTVAKKLLKQYAEMFQESSEEIVEDAEEVNADSMEDETGMNEVPEEKNEDFEPAKMVKDEYKDMKIEEPQVDGDAEAKKFLKKNEEVNEEAITEISKSNAEEDIDLRQLDYAQKLIKAKQTGKPEDQAIADEAKEKATKAAKLLKKWKKAKGYDESVNESTKVLDNGKEFNVPDEAHEIVRQNLLDVMRGYGWVELEQLQDYIKEEGLELTDEELLAVAKTCFKYTKVFDASELQDTDLQDIKDAYGTVIVVGDFKRLPKNESVNEEELKKFLVQDVDLNSKDPIPDSQDQFDTLEDAMECLKKRHVETPDKYIEVVDTEDDSIVASTDEIEDGTIEESLNEEVVAKFNNGKHEIIKCKEGYYNRYNIKNGKARTTTQCVESLPSALNALKKRYPKAEEDK